MLYKLFAFLALVAVAFASPKPEPQVFAYGAGVLPATYPYLASGVYAGAAPYAAPYAALPYAYNGYYVK